MSAEKALLCAMMQSPAAAELGTRLVGAEAFENRMHAEIWQAIRDELGNAEAIDPLRVAQRLTASGSHAAPMVPEIYTLGTPVPTLRSWAQDVREAHKRRELAAIATRIEQAAHELDADALLEFVSGQASLLGETLDGTDENAEIPGLVPLADFADQPDDPQSWIVPNLLESGDVVMMLAGEGAGKSVLSRMMCLTIAAGVHPFQPSRRIDPQRTLLIDLENAAGTIRRDARSQVHSVQHLTHGEFDSDLAWLWHYPRGLDLRKAKDAQLLERVIARVQPKFVAFGSLYKAYTQGSDSYEAAAQEVRVVLDRMRAKYGVAFWLEHHMPKGDGKERPRTPYGASEWMKWAAYGRVLEHVHGSTFELRQFRGDRESGREWPAGLERGGVLRWTAVDEDELDYLKQEMKRR